MRPKSDDEDERVFLDKRRKGKIDPDYENIPTEGYANVFYKYNLGIGKSRQEVDNMWNEYLKNNPPSQ